MTHKLLNGSPRIEHRTLARGGGAISDLKKDENSPAAGWMACLLLLLPLLLLPLLLFGVLGVSPRHACFRPASGYKRRRRRRGETYILDPLLLFWERKSARTMKFTACCPVPTCLPDARIQKEMEGFIPNYRRGKGKIREKEMLRKLFAGC